MQEGNPDDLVRLHDMLEAASEVIDQSKSDAPPRYLIRDKCHDANPL